MVILIKVLQFILALSLLIIIHELGHFTAAKIFKTRVEKFYLFFDWGFSLVRCKRVNGKLRWKFFAKNGYSITYFGRRRPIPELESTNFMQKSFGERVAMNSPVQGTAADIIKLAMLKVYERLEKENPASKLLLQIHDELLIETPLEDVQKVRAIVEEEMKNAVNLAVGLEVGIEEGKSWFEAH